MVSFVGLRLGEWVKSRRFFVLSGLLCSHHSVSSFYTRTGQPPERTPWQRRTWRCCVVWGKFPTFRVGAGSGCERRRVGGHKKPGIESNPAIGLPAPVSCGLALVCRETVFVPPNAFWKTNRANANTNVNGQCQWQKREWGTRPEQIVPSSHNQSPSRLPRSHEVGVWLCCSTGEENSHTRLGVRVIKPIL